MNSKIILIILGEPNSTFSEILLKYFTSVTFNKNRNKVIILGNKRLFEMQMRILKYKIPLHEIFNINMALSKKVNILNIKYKFNKAFSKISNKSNRYIENSFNLALKIISTNPKVFLINGPISKKYFLRKKYPGITEYVGKKTNSKETVMLIYNKNLSVSPLTTHIPLKNVVKFIKKKRIINHVNKIDNFYKAKLKKTPKIAVLGLNPHCETIDKVSEEKNEIIPAIKFLKKKNLKVYGPYSGDTFFLKKNIKKFDVVIGMYHDQVLTPVKTLFEFEAINITIGLPFIKITPDHGPNYDMLGKNKSDPSSIFYALDFLNKIR